MRKSLMILVAAALMLVPVAVSAQTTASATVTVQATVQRALSITPASNTLNFGTVVAGAAVAPSVAPASGVTFAVQGENSKGIYFTYDASTTMTGPGATDITFAPSVIGGTTNVVGSASAVPSEASVGSLALSGTGNFYLWVGGSLTVPGATVPGAYSGTWHLSVAY